MAYTVQGDLSSELRHVMVGHIYKSGRFLARQMAKQQRPTFSGKAMPCNRTSYGW